MGRRVKLIFKNLFCNNLLLYFFLIFFLIMGLVFGVIAVKILTEQQLMTLGNYLDLQLANVQSIDAQTIMMLAVGRNLETIFKIWFLGLTVVGLPLVLIIIFSRGFALGFTVGFMLESKAWQGLGLVLIAILPQNIFYLPVLILAGVAAISFCGHLLNSRKRECTPFWQSFLRYSLIMTGLALIMVLAGLVEGYILPFVLSFWQK